MKEFYYAIKDNNLEKIQTLIIKNPTLVQLNINDRTFLHWAARLNHLDLVNALIKAGVDINDK